MAPFTSLTLTAALAAASLFGGALAHPGEEHSAEKIRKGIEARDAAQANAGLVTRRCAGSATRAALQSRAAARRSVAAQLLREKRGIVHSRSRPLFPLVVSGPPAELTRAANRGHRV